LQANKLARFGRKFTRNFGTTQLPIMATVIRYNYGYNNYFLLHIDIMSVPSELPLLQCFIGANYFFIIL